MIEVNVLNRGAIERDLALFPEKAKRIYGMAVDRAAEALRDHTKNLRPVSAKTTGYGAKGIPVDHGHLRKTIRKKKLASLAAGVFPNTGSGGKGDYGVYVHEGTSKMPARPF